MEVILNNDCTSFQIVFPYDSEVTLPEIHIKELDEDTFVNLTGTEVIADDELTVSYTHSNLTSDSIYVVELRDGITVLETHYALFNCRSLKCYNDVTYNEAKEIINGEAKIDNYKLIKAYNRAIIATYKIANYDFCKQLIGELTSICNECSTCNCGC